MELSEVKDKISEMRSDGKSYAYIGEFYGVNKGIIYFIHKRDYEPRRKDIRRKLGLEDLVVDFVKQVRNEKGRFTKRGR